MGKRFGKARVPGCECTTAFTCGPCLRAAKPYHFTTSTGAVLPPPVDLGPAPHAWRLTPETEQL